jgi:signal transduction histidine kinase
MQQIALAQWAHDIRNTLGTVGLYVDTLKRPSDPRSCSIVASAHALLAKAAAMCDGAVKQIGQDDHASRRSGIDVAAIVEQVRDLVAPTLPRDCSLHVAIRRPTRVIADPQDVFRILFNLVHNAAAVARRSAALQQIHIAVECTDTTAIVTVADDGPGLPEAVRSRLFHRGESTTGGSGYGLAIARELAERNGGVLELAEAARGTAFVIELPLEARSRRQRDATCARFRSES